MAFRTIKSDGISINNVTEPGRETGINSGCAKDSTVEGKWEFWVDRGGTFTDMVAKDPAGKLSIHKFLSHDPLRYGDPVIHAIRSILSHPEYLSEAPATPDGVDEVPLSSRNGVPADRIRCIRMGTTVGTNALLERTGRRVALFITRGFKDSLRIGYQNRPDIFAQQIKLPQMLYETVVEVSERCSATGEILQVPDHEEVGRQLREVYNCGIRSIAVVLMHSFKYPDHEIAIEQIARDIGFEQVSLSHKVSPLMKLVARGETAMVDAYLSPVLREYVDSLMDSLGCLNNDDLMFMQSSGGLVRGNEFQGKDSILSGPAGGIVGAVEVSKLAGFNRIISFDMGGTSTDVAHYCGEYEREIENEIAGVHLHAPMMNIHTVAAGGGSILSFDKGRYQVGPDSAGCDPGPACYGKGGPLTVTDCNVMLGKIRPEYFPKVFGEYGNAPLDIAKVYEKFDHLSGIICDELEMTVTAEDVAEGFLTVAVENMANAIKRISVQKGYDLSEYTLCCFGGAGGQHACLVAASLGMEKVLIHPYAGVLSAYGIGLADHRLIKESSIERPLDGRLICYIDPILNELDKAGRKELQQQGVLMENIHTVAKLYIKYAGTDTPLIVDYDRKVVDQIPDPLSADHRLTMDLKTQFNRLHKHRFGFTMEEKELIVTAACVEVIGSNPSKHVSFAFNDNPSSPEICSIVSMYSAGSYHDTPVYERKNLGPAAVIPGPAIICEDTTTIVVEPSWEACMTAEGNLILKCMEAERKPLSSDHVDPMLLEVFNNRFMSIAEQMGYRLQNTAHSVNIKERLDFSCALFDGDGHLVANAPHIPVHLGSMEDSVQAVIRNHGGNMEPSDAYMLNSPYAGGTHLPDITVISPVFCGRPEPVFYVASRGHHADIGGISPGSMPPESCSIEEEGVLISDLKLVSEGSFMEKDVLDLFTSGIYPARDPQQNIADLKAQLAANEKGILELEDLVSQYGLEHVLFYMSGVQDNAEEAVKKALEVLSDGSYSCTFDDDSRIAVKISIDHVNKEATIDFTGTSKMRNDNFNAPLSVCRAAVLYVFRTLVKENIPLNAGCLRPLKLIVAQGCMLSPVYPAAVVAGNVETSQYIVDCLFGALGVMAGSQGTMNNFTFGNQKYQYYETICGGSGAGPGFNGTDAVHTHMTNSRITDPEVLESRFPVLVEEFSIRKDSGGSGMFKGGNGAVRRIRFLEPMQAAILSSHRKYPPSGINGGDPGACGENYLIRNSGFREDVAGVARIDVDKGDALEIRTPGGGGFGKFPEDHK